jgi:hypothetical protein
MIPPGRHRGRRGSVNVREVLNGIFYVLWTGCQWKALRKDLPPKSTASPVWNGGALHLSSQMQGSAALARASRSDRTSAPLSRCFPALGGWYSKKMPGNGCEGAPSSAKATTLAAELETRTANAAADPVDHQSAPWTRASLRRFLNAPDMRAVATRNSCASKVAPSKCHKYQSSQ